MSLEIPVVRRLRLGSPSDIPKSDRLRGILTARIPAGDLMLLFSKY